MDADKKSRTSAMRSLRRLAFSFGVPSKSNAQFTVQRDLQFVNERIRERLRPYDLHGRVLSKEPHVVGIGGFSDIFRGVCLDAKNKEVRVAMKHLRLHVNAAGCQRVSCASAGAGYHISC